MFEWSRFIFEEVKFLKSFNDLRNLCKKFPYFIPRLTGNFYRGGKTPLSLQIEPTNYCDINCICCSRDRMSRKKGYMNLDLFRKIIDDAASNNVKRIHLYLHGEPLLHPKLIEMIRYIKMRGLGFQMATNGMLLDKAKIQQILNAGVNNADHIIFSILGHSKETHEQIMRGVRHEKVLENISEFLKLRKKFKVNGPIIETVMYVMQENKNEQKKFMKYWRRVADHVRNVGNISEQFSKFKKGDISAPAREKTCKNLWERMTIYWNGDVTICCADLDGNYILGNLEEKSIQEIWNFEKLLSIKTLHKKKQFQELALCSNCDW